MLPIYFPSINLLIGTPGSGKSYMIKSLIFQTSLKKQFDYIVVFCNTSFDGYKFLPQEYVHNVYDENIMNNIIKIQIKNPSAKCLIILDDVVGSINFNTNLWRKIVSQFRHYNMSLFFSVQYIKSIPPLVRECANFCFIFQTSSKKTIKELYEQYGQIFDTESAFKRFIISNTQDFNTILINVKEGDFKKKFLQYKAQPIKNDILIYQ